MKKLILIMLILATIVCCTEDPSINMPVYNNRLSSKEALDILKSSYPELARTRGESTEYLEQPIINISVNDTTYQVYHYILKGDKSGFALISSDKRYPEVICYIPEGSLSDTLYNEGLNIMKNLAEAQMIEEIELNGARRRDGDSTYVKELLAEVEPLLSTKWNQTSPYNKKAPASDCSNFSSSTAYKGRYPAGCQTIAAAQVFGYYNITCGLPINWTMLKENPEIYEFESTKVDQISSLINKIATNCNITYSSLGGAIDTEDIRSFMSQNQLNLGKDKYGIWNDSMLAWFDEGNLIYIVGRQQDRQTGNPGVGHAWILDGYKKYTKNVGSRNNFDIRLHANFGYGGSGDGYFAVGERGSMLFTAPTGVYSYIESFFKVSKK